MKIAHLVVVSGAKPAEYQIKLPSVLGRGRSANLTVPDPMVSRLHCKLFVKQGRLAIRDLGSLNGTYVNHKRISRDTILSPGDVIMLGDIQLSTVYKTADDVKVTAPHDTDLEITPLEQTQPVHETTIVREADYDETHVGSSNGQTSGASGDLSDTGATISDGLSSNGSALEGFSPHFKTSGGGKSSGQGFEAESSHDENSSSDGSDVNGVASGVGEAHGGPSAGKSNRFRGTPHRPR